MRATPFLAAVAVCVLTAACGADPARPTPAEAPATTRPAGGSGTDGPGRTLPPGPLTLITIGDSVTAGDGDDAGLGGYPGRLRAALDHGDRAGTSVVNLGLAGSDSGRLLADPDGMPAQVPHAVRAVQRAVTEHRPAVVLVLVGANDLWDLYAPEAPTTAEQEQEGLRRYRANLERLVPTLQDAGAVVVLASADDVSRRPVLADDARRREAFGGITRDELPRLSAQAERYAQVVREVAAARGALVAELLHHPLFADPTTLSADGNRPNGRGYQALADVWLATLRPIL